MLNGVDVLSPSNVWAVGSYDPLDGSPTTQLVEHWDGTTWTALGVGRGVLRGVAAVSRTNVWVVGYPSSRPGRGSWTLHWDGTTWKAVTTPRHTDILYGVAAVSAANIWAVGNGGVLHWNGIAWKRVLGPVPGRVLLAVAASSPTHVWAVGYSGGSAKTLVLRWNGTRWKRVASPNPAGTATGNLNILDSVTAISRHNVWAVGYDAHVADGPRKTLIEHWNGTRWKHVASPNPGELGSVLAGVAASSASNVWAVGEYGTASGGLTLTARWNGTRWKQIASPSPVLVTPPSNDGLNAVAVTSAVNVWAVGSIDFDETLAIRRC